MAMTVPGLSAKLQTEFNAKFGASVAGFEGSMVDLCDALAKAIVEYIQANAVVPNVTTGANTSTVT